MLKHIRTALGKSQREMAELLGISVRAIQSYEQRWRTIPSSVDKLARFTMFLRWRRDHRDGVPCWEIKRCDPAHRASCAAAALGAGEYCWLVTGNCLGGERQKSWQAKIARCEQCPVMRRWLSHNGD